METFAEKFIAEIAMTELDLDWPFYNSENNLCNEVLTSSKVQCDVPSISLDNLELLIMKLKAAGAKRVYISTHEDHQGYHFYGVELIKI
jgi:hypothetical protein